MCIVLPTAGRSLFFLSRFASARARTRVFSWRVKFLMHLKSTSKGVEVREVGATVVAAVCSGNWRCGAVVLAFHLQMGNFLF